MNKHCYEIHTLNWRGTTIEVTYERNWLRCEGYSPATLPLPPSPPCAAPCP